MRLLAAIAAAALASAAAAGATTAPRVAIDGLSPVVVVGSGFGATAQVRVTVASGDVWLSKTVRSTATGTFRAVWRTTLHADRCASLAVTAVSGAKRATWKRTIARTCGPPPPAP